MTSLSILVSKNIAIVETLNHGSRPTPTFFSKCRLKIIDKVVGYRFYDGIQAYLANKASPIFFGVSL
jgi:hypothetical protein